MVAGYLSQEHPTWPRMGAIESMCVLVPELASQCPLHTSGTQLLDFPIDRVPIVHLKKFETTK